MIQSIVNSIGENVGVFPVLFGAFYLTMVTIARSIFDDTSKGLTTFIANAVFAIMIVCLVAIVYFLSLRGWLVFYGIVSISFVRFWYGVVSYCIENFSRFKRYITGVWSDIKSIFQNNVFNKK